MTGPQSPSVPLQMSGDAKRENQGAGVRESKERKTDTGMPDGANRWLIHVMLSSLKCDCSLFHCLNVALS